MPAIEILCAIAPPKIHQISEPQKKFQKDIAARAALLKLCAPFRLRKNGNRNRVRPITKLLQAAGSDGRTRKGDRPTYY